MPASEVVRIEEPESADTLASKKLSEIEWNFANRVSHSDLEGIHPYPAKFIGEIPRSLLATLKPPSGTSVFDPYCGSGTTLVESQKRGIPSIGVDLNPIACLMTRVKISPMPGTIHVSLNSVLKGAQQFDGVKIPSIPNLDHWFVKPVQQAIASIGQAIAQADEQCRDILRLALSSIIVRVSNQESDTRYAAIEKNVGKRDVFLAFQRSALRIIEALSSRNYPLVPARIIEADTLALSPEQIEAKIGLVITSPPYPNAYEYWLYHKYRMWWLGFDPLAVKAKEIGARAHFFKSNHHTAQHFEHQMADTFRLLGRVMVPGGYVCFVVGRSKIHGEIVDNAKIVKEAAEAQGFRHLFAIDRELAVSRKSFNLSHANIKTETVAVYKLDQACS
jgi:site-specific DNA-methyltransferase (cytosine-N4-specific)